MMPNPADGYNERHIRKMKWRRIVTILSCIVVFCTTYALIMPAVTMSRDTACGKEEHTHTEACYDENGALICGREEHTHTDACLLAVRELTYEDGQLTICLRVESMDPLPEDLTLSVEEPQAAVQSAADGSGQTFTRRLTLLSQGQQVDTSSYAMTATVQVKPQALEPLEAALEQLRQEAPESDTGISLTLSQTTGRQEEQLAEELMLPGGEIPAVTADVCSGVISVQAAGTANPHYTVQYYANIPRFNESGSNPLTVIDTSGGKLPQNRQTLTTKEIYLTPADGNTNKNNGNATQQYRVAESKQLTRMYTDNKFEYIKSPNPSYINKLMDSPSYTLAQLWVLKDGKSSSSENRADWDVYDNPGSVHFTNREGVTGDNVVYIQDGTVIRLVYNTDRAEESFPANFYDYDISGGQDSAGRYLTGRNGINAASNYGTSRNGKRTWGSYCDVLAFGNDNCGTGMSRYRFDELFLNKYSTKWTDSNKETHTIGADQYGCTFGLADSLKDEKIVYNEWLVAPDLFNEGTANGKTIYTNDSSLTFSRVGDTYTLSAATVGGVGTINDLQYLFNPSPSSTTTYGTIFTNDFWPLDGAANGIDPLFGKDTPDFYGYDADAQGGDTSKTNVWKETAGRLPASDDGNNHNCFFGMQYAVKFTLTADYVGPLEYYFFGDDDMWVFLDDKLVCDIGGVHSSVGEYVNLWDYLKKNGRTESETHTLTFFYTERGASGSTCYMNFTLPSVSGVNIEQKTSDLEVRKQVVGQDESNPDFEFNIRFYDQNGKTVLDDYAYTKYDKDGRELNGDLVVHTGDKFTLQDGQYVRIRYLPFGLRYTITEEAVNGYTVSSTINGVTGQGSEAKGTILNTGQMNTVLFTNTMTYKGAITLQKQDLDGHILTGAAFRLVDSKGNTVNVVDNGSGSYTVPSTADDLIKDGELYYIASAAGDSYVIAYTTEADFSNKTGSDQKVSYAAKLQKKDGSKAQQYRVYRQEDGSYSFRSMANERYWLDLDAENLENTHIVHFWDNASVPTDHDNQKWYITVTETGLKIKPRQAVLKKSTAVLDLYGSKLEQGGRIEVYEDNGTAAQRWKLVPVNSAAAVTTTDTLTVDANGRLTIQGLLPGTYTLKEVTAPGGYQTMADATIKVDADGRVTRVSGSPLVSADQSQITVKNRPTDKTLTLTKQVVGPDTGKQKFGFTVTYVDAITGETKTEKWNLANGGSNTLQIPYGATVTISEPSHPGYSLSFRQGDMLVTNLDKNSYQFVITDDVTIIAVNTAGYELPDTGGPGAVWYTTGGLLLMAAAGGLLLYKNRNRRKGGRLLS